jgi:hypothetical protein
MRVRAGLGISARAKGRVPRRIVVLSRSVSLQSLLRSSDRKGGCVGGPDECGHQVRFWEEEEDEGRPGQRWEHLFALFAVQTTSCDEV